LGLAGSDARVRPSARAEPGLRHGAPLVFVRAARERAVGAGDDGSADGTRARPVVALGAAWRGLDQLLHPPLRAGAVPSAARRRDERSEEHTSELQSPCNLVCRLLLEKK